MQLLSTALCDWYMPQENVIPGNGRQRDKFSGLSKETQSGFSLYMLALINLEYWLQMNITISNVIFLQTQII